MKTKSSRSRCRVLLAEDNPANLALAMAVLALVECDVTCVQDGVLALDAFRQGNFDLVLLDYQMPEMDGGAVAKSIRDFESASNKGAVWIVALTASAMPQEVQRCIDAGMNEVITKPIDVVRFRDLVDHVCKREHLRPQN